jgi:hypothetical protein
MTLKKAFVFIVAVLPIILSALLFSFVIIFDATSLSVGFFLLGIGFCISGILLDILSISIINGAKKPSFLIGIGLGLLIPLVFISYIGRFGDGQGTITPTSPPIPTQCTVVVPNLPCEQIQLTSTASEGFSFFDENIWSVVSNSNAKTSVYNHHLDLSPFGFYSSGERTSLEQNQFQINSPSVDYVNSYAAVKRRSDTDNQYQIQISNLVLSGPSNCPRDCSCDTQLFFGIGEPFQNREESASILVTGEKAKSGFFLVFRKYYDLQSGTYKNRVCLLDSLYTPCNEPLSQVDNMTDSELFNSSWEVSIDKQGRQITFDVVEKNLSGEEKPLTTNNDDNALINEDDSFYVGYSIKNFGFVNAIITVN